MFFMESPMGLLLAVLSLAIAMIAQASVKNAYNKYSKVKTQRGLTGAEAARMIVERTGVTVVRHNGGELSDHFDPRTNTIALSPAVYDGSSVAALGIAAHEAGHALQHEQGYFPIVLRNGILPLAQIGTMAAFPLIIAGMFFTAMEFLIDLGILFFIFALVFQVITLPVEFNASRRAVSLLDGNYLTPDESRGARVVLRAAAMTYVAAVAASILQLIRLLMLANRRN